MCAERVRRADRRAGGYERERAACSGVVRVCANVDAPERAEHDCSGERRERSHVREARAHPSDAEDGCSEECGHYCGRVVRLDGGLRDGAREQVQSELGKRSEQREWCSEREQRQREQQRGEVRQVAVVERRRLVAALERRGTGGGEVGDDDERRDQRHGRTGHGDRRTRPGCPMTHGVPDADRRHREPDVLLGRNRCGREERERPHPALVEVPPREQEQRARERDRVEVAHGQPLHRGQEEVRQGERGAGSVRRDMLPCQPEDRQCPGGDGDRLQNEQHLGVGPEPPERCQQDEDRVEVRAQSRDLVAMHVRDGQDVAVGGRPDRLGHVAEAPALEGAVPEHGGHSESSCEGGGHGPDEDGGRH